MAQYLRLYSCSSQTTVKRRHHHHHPFHRYQRRTAAIALAAVLWGYRKLHHTCFSLFHLLFAAARGGRVFLCAALTRGAPHRFTTYCSTPRRPVASVIALWYTVMHRASLHRANPRRAPRHIAAPRRYAGRAAKGMRLLDAEARFSFYTQSNPRRSHRTISLTSLSFVFFLFTFL